ncbi:MAG: Coenzyme F420 hydrogenase/dehydrogenase, beta subunit C-terminal domain [Erysipelotrichaceae bacterium]
MIKITNKDECCGCGACANICPKKCITMTEDQEGFLYPVVEESDCIDCSLCETVCPILNSSKGSTFEKQGYIIQNKDQQTLKESTSGGFFTAIANYTLEKNGTVYGVAFDEDFNVKHERVTDSKELYKFRNSKYVQSNTNDTYSQVKKDLFEGKEVCYSGTPCQIEGLKKFLVKKYDNLITVDIVCHSVPSPLIFRKYLKMQEKKFNIKPTEIKFRDKAKYGYKYSNMTLANNNDVYYSAGIDTDQFMRSFFADMSVRPSCYNCHFKKIERVSDFTIWDCFVESKFDKNFDDNKGTTRVLVHSEKAGDIFENIKINFNYKEVEVDNLVKGVTEMFESVKCNKKRSDFFKDAIVLEDKELFDKYFPITMKTRLARQVRIFLCKTGLTQRVKNCLNFIRGK